MIASEARRKSLDVILKHETDELKKIDSMIQEAVRHGEFSCSYDGNISASAKSELERCGYKVITGLQYNEGYVIIRWSL